MKKTIFLLILCFTLPLLSCGKENELYNKVSDLRYDVLVGKTENYELKAYAEIKETPLNYDGKVGETANYITFTIVNDVPDSVYTCAFTIDKKEYSGSFALDFTGGKYRSSVEIQSKVLSPLTVTVFNAGKVEKAELKSVLPENTLSPEKALIKLKEKNPSLFDYFRDGNGIFDAEIQLKATEKNGKAYYFVGITGGNERKIFLADGINAEVLAVRTVA